MTDKQLKKWYMPAWRRCALSHDWIDRGGICTAKPNKTWAAPDLQEILDRIWACARAQACDQRTALRSDYFRYAIHAEVTGKVESCKNLANDQAERVVCLFKILADPDNFDALIEYSNPGARTRRRLVHTMETRMRPKYLEAVCRKLYGTPDWLSLETDCLSTLYATCKRHRNAWLSEREQTKVEAGLPF